MKKLTLASMLLLLLLIGSSCSSPKSLDDAYIIALEALLVDKDFEYAIDYISLFFNDESISNRDVEIIKRHFQKTYQKEIYTYTPDEVTHAGPYGKENLNMDGMFLYLLEINEHNGTMIFKTAKYHTVSGRGALGKEVVLHHEKQGWMLQKEEVLWSE